MRGASRRRAIREASKTERRARVTHLDLQPDALGVATRLATVRLREAGVVLKPLLRSAGLSASQINRKDIRIGVASQIRFLELAAKALNDPLLGFRLTRDADVRFVGLLYYVVADARRRARAGRALQFDRQCRRRSKMFRSRQSHDYLALRRCRQTFRSATDGVFGDSDYPLLQGFNGPPPEPARRPFRSSR